DVRARIEGAKPNLGVAETVEDPSDLSQAGWGVIFADNADPAIRDALGELLRHRAEQARGRNAAYYKEYSGERGYHRGESKWDFLRNRGAAPSGPADPEGMPYYLLLVGDPEAIPYSLQYQLDVQYAVGRVHFDSPQQYADYAHAVVTAEHGGNPRSRRAALVGVANADDRATRLSASRLVQPLFERLLAWQAQQDETSRWSVEHHVGDAAYKAGVCRLLGGDNTPALLFTASHGLGFPNGDRRQARQQGALVCENWPGPVSWRGELPPEWYVSADDIPDQAKLLGLITFHFACFGAGTPRLDDFPQLGGTSSTLSAQLARSIAPQAFLAQLPTRLLGHPGGGALAVVGHVERALGSSFLWASPAGQQASVTAFEAALRRLMLGAPVGLAMETFNARYAELCSDLTQQVRRVNQQGRLPDEAELAQLWMGSTDARGYVVLGDPAARLVVGTPPRGASSSVTHTTMTMTPDSANPTEPSAIRQLTPGAARAANVRIDVDPNTGHVVVTTEGAFRQPSTPTGTSDDTIDYGLFGSSSPITPMAEGLKGLADQLTSALGKLASDVSTLKVSTYTSDALDTAKYDAEQQTFGGPVTLCAFSSIRFDGETVSIVPEHDGVVDDKLWNVHKDMVERAQAHRAEFIAAAAAAASSILNALRGV
ncbi:MAG: hypothetical protein LC797_18640, partial [Chloroflexi bacterium]|nr:hypothetical protein [Chloroflexota bacterium]